MDMIKHSHIERMEEQTTEDNILRKCQEKKNFEFYFKP